MSIFSDYAHGYLTDREFRSAGAREYGDEDREEIDLEEDEEEDDGDD